MTVYLRCANFFALYLETNASFGTGPVFENITFKGERIIHLPWIEIIFTPRRVLTNIKNENETGNTSLHTTAFPPAGG